MVRCLNRLKSADNFQMSWLSLPMTWLLAFATRSIIFTFVDLVGKLPALLKFSVGETRKIGRWFYLKGLSSILSVTSWLGEFLRIIVHRRPSTVHCSLTRTSTPISLNIGKKGESRLLNKVHVKAAASGYSNGAILSNREAAHPLSCAFSLPIVNQES